MAPGPIPREYALQKEVDELKEKVNRITDSVVVLVEVMKLLVMKSYGKDPGAETAQEIFNRATKMVDSWEE